MPDRIWRIFSAASLPSMVGMTTSVSNRFDAATSPAN